MSTELRLVLLLVISLLQTGSALDIELDLFPEPARVVKTTRGVGVGRCDSTVQPDESQSLRGGMKRHSAPPQSAPSAG